MTAVRYPTEQLHNRLNGHENRIESLEKSKGSFEDHLQKHHDVYDELLKAHDKTLYGENRDDGMAFDMKQIMRLYKKVDSLTAAVVIAIIVELAIRLFFK
jgi:predicted nuclease with TOPRIM domain